MTLLVTGAMGHVGLELVRQAAAGGDAVLALYHRTFDADAARAIPGTVHWASCDLADPAAVGALVAAHRIDGCIHTAAVPNDRLARPDPFAAFRANVDGTAVLLDLARRERWRRFVFVSTGSVFQRETDVTRPLREDHPASAHTVYGTTKRMGELMVRMHRGEFGMSAASVRISWVYGPPLVPAVRDLPRGPIPAFLKDAVAGIPVREPAGGDFAASFTHVEDVAAGLLAAWRAPTLGHDMYHLGSGENYDTHRVAAAVRAAVPGSIVEVGPGTEPWTTFNTLRGPLAGTRLADDAGFHPRYSLESGIAAFADWMRAHPERWRLAGAA